MKFFKKLKSSNFWVSMISAVVLILQAVFNVEIKTEYLSQIIMAILGLLVMSGIVTDSPNGEVTVSEKLDVEAIKKDVVNIVESVTSSFEKGISGIIEGMQSKTVSNDGATERSAVEQAVIQPIANIIAETTIEQEAERYEVKTEEVEIVQPVVEQIKIEEDTDVL